MEQVESGALFFHPERRSMMLWIMDSTSRRRSENINAADEEWNPTMVLGHEFSLLPFLYPQGFPNHRSTHRLGGNGDVDLLLTTGCESMQAMQNKLFRLGFGPLPYFRRSVFVFLFLACLQSSHFPSRPGALLNISESARDHDDPARCKLGVVVSHTPGLHGCTFGSTADPAVHLLHADERCYFCQDNPFYEVLFNRTGAAGNSWGRTARIQPARAIERCIATGSKLLLRADAMERIVAGFKYKVLSHFVTLSFGAVFLSQSDQRQQDQPHRKDKRRRNCFAQGSSGRSRKMAMMSASRCVVDAMQRELLQLQERNVAGGAANDDEDANNISEKFVQCFLNITPMPYARDGFVCVAVACVSHAKDGDPKAENLFVYPQDLKMPSDSQEWDDALGSVVL